jgi:hypothetical protein
MRIGNHMTADQATQELNDAAAERIRAAPVWAPNDRRRPGRMERVSPALTELLRLQPSLDMHHLDNREAHDASGLVRGVLFGAVPGLLMWVGLIWLLEDLLR